MSITNRSNPIRIVVPDSDGNALVVDDGFTSLCDTEIKGSLNILKSGLITLNDSFSYPDGSIHGVVAPNGKQWKVTGLNSEMAKVISKSLCYSPRNSDGGPWYAYIDTGSPIYAYSQTFTVIAASGNDGLCHVPAMAICGNVANPTDKMIHAVFSATSVTLTWWNGASQNNTPYYSSTSDGKWITGISMSEGHTYTITLIWDGGNWVYLVGPDGGVMSYYDTNFASVGGSMIFNEHGWASTYQNYPAVTNITTTSSSGSFACDSVLATRIDGAIGTRFPSSGIFSKVKAKSSFDFNDGSDQKVSSDLYSIINHVTQSLKVQDKANATVIMRIGGGGNVAANVMPAFKVGNPAAGTGPYLVGDDADTAAFRSAAGGAFGGDYKNLKVANVVVTNTTTPADSSAAGIANTIWSDGNYLYYCVASGNIKRVALSTF